MSLRAGPEQVAARREAKHLHSLTSINSNSWQTCV